MTFEQFTKYCAQFDAKYVSQETAKDIIKQAKKVIDKRKNLDELSSQAQEMGY